MSNTKARIKASDSEWPYIRYSEKEKAFKVDARTKDGGSRRFFKTKTEAETFAQQCRIQQENEGRASFGSADLAKFGKTVQDAINFYLAHLRRNSRSVPLSVAIEELIQQTRNNRRSEEYCYSIGLRLRRFARELEDRSVAAISTKELAAWLGKMDAAPATRNTFRRDLVTLFSYCVSSEYIVSNPALGTKETSDASKGVEILTPSEARCVLAHSSPDLLPYNAIQIFAGLRTSEMKKLQWQDVDLEHGTIEVRHENKTGRRIVRIEPTLKAWLEPIAQTSGAVVSTTNLRRRLTESRRAAGFGSPGTETAKERAAGVELVEWKSNCQRHSYGSYWLAMHRDMAALALQMGNSPAVIRKSYLEWVKPKEAEAFWAIRPE